MSKTTKNVLIVITLVCIFVFAVFCIELIVLNRGRNKEEATVESPKTSSPITGTQRPDNTSSVPLDDTTPPSDTDETEDSPAESPIDRSGKRYLLPYTPNEMLVVYADEDIFEYEEINDGDIFTYIDGGSTSLEICFVSLPLGAEQCATETIDAYLDGNEAFIGGEGPIKRSSLNGVFITGVNDGETFEVWVHRIPDDDDDAFNDIGMAFIIRYKDNEQKNALYALLDTLELVDA
ncbi:MAG: hypothetical protein FWH33_03325 [Oscillospiraceae bacterium]|nr:hypothetical protein [Oscillospiraceae bacterium]